MKRVYGIAFAAMLATATSVVTSGQAEARGWHHGGGWRGGGIAGPLIGGLALGAALGGAGYYGYYGPRRYYYDSYYPGDVYYYSSGRPYGWRHYRHRYHNWRD